VLFTYEWGDRLIFQWTPRILKQFRLIILFLVSTVCSGRILLISRDPRHSTTKITRGKPVYPSLSSNLHKHSSAVHLIGIVRYLCLNCQPNRISQWICFGHADIKVIREFRCRSSLCPNPSQRGYRRQLMLFAPRHLSLSVEVCLATCMWRSSLGLWDPSSVVGTRPGFRSVSWWMNWRVKRDCAMPLDEEVLL
jgi:hypothetical protein